MTPKRLVVAAAILVAAYAALDALGARSATAALAGAGPSTSAMLAVAYLVAWFAAVLLAPPLVIAAGVLQALRVVEAMAPSARDADNVRTTAS